MATAPEDFEPLQLFADELVRDDACELIHFNCGDEPWAKEATEWIIGSDAWESIHKRGTRVWLYRNVAGVIVGFGSLALDRWGLLAESGHRQMVGTAISYSFRCLDWTLISTASHLIPSFVIPIRSLHTFVMRQTCCSPSTERIHETRCRFLRSWSTQTMPVQYLSIGDSDLRSRIERFAVTNF